MEGVIKDLSSGELSDVTAVPEESRTQKESSLFWLWFASNLTIGDFAIGLLAQSFGMSYAYTIIALILGTVMGGALLGLMSLMGPHYGLSQMKIGRITFGNRGGTIMAVLQWGNTLGWFTFNSIIAAFALSLAIGTNLSTISIFITVTIVFALTALGHRMIQWFERVMSVVLGIMFVVILALAIDRTGLFGGISAGTGFSAISFGWIVAFSFSYLMSWGPYASDYSRFVSPKRSAKKIVLLVMLGGCIASFFSEFAGYYVGIATGSASSNPSQPLAQFMGKYALLGLYFLFLGGLSANALNLYSNTVSIRSAGLHVKRRYIALVVVIAAGILSYIGYNNFYLDYEDFLFILDYWITPWIAVMLVDFFLRTGGRMPGNSRELINYRAISAYAIGIAVSVPFMYPPTIFVGPLASLLGFDISYFISFIVAGVIYLLLCLQKYKKYPTHNISAA